MAEHVLLGLVAVIVLGIGAQWLAWRLKVPSILLLLAFGFLAGPVSGLVLERPLLNPNELMGDLLLPFVSLAVALILYEGGLTLRFAELRGGGTVLWRLVTVGAAATLLLVAAAARLLLDFPFELAILLGAILVVTGPTVIIPLLREIRPKSRVRAILKWEGIVIDPIGAMLAVLVFEVITLQGEQSPFVQVITIVFRTVVVGGGLGVLAGLLLALLLRAYWIPDFLDNAVSLMIVLAAYALAELVQSESGLFTATVMGITLANQRLADVRHIVEFKENLRVLLLATLFIMLAARVQIETLNNVGLASLAFMLVLIVVVRPLSVLLSSIGSPLPWTEKAFLALTAPRGIVAASVSAVFALRLGAMQYEHAEFARELVPITFIAIVGTVMFCSVVLPSAARWLGVAEPQPQGVLFVGAHPWARAMAEALKKLGLRVLMVDTNRRNIAAARMLGLDVYFGNVLTRQTIDDIDLAGIGKLFATTPNDSVNLLAVQRFWRTFGRSNVYLVAPQRDSQTEKKPSEEPMQGRFLFDRRISATTLAERISKGGFIKVTPITASFTYDDFKRHSGGKSIPMFVYTETKKLVVATDGQTIDPRPGQTLVSLVEEKPADAS